MTYQLTDEQRKRIVECAAAIDQLFRQPHTYNDIERELSCLIVEFASAIREAGRRVGIEQVASWCDAAGDHYQANTIRALKTKEPS